ncbi:MAG: sigma-70 family RNA polymerase sigma factor, partial [Planctomycetota bacterium]
FAAHRETLWGAGYRLLGTAADADELVQEAFVRLLESPPRDLDRPLLPWLRRVTVNLALDRLRRRKAQPYVGSWLPGPVSSARCEELLAAEEPGPAARVERRESLSLAFLLALEALTPTQRGVLVLRDALGLTTRETAEALDLSEANVKTTLHRARQALEAQPARVDAPLATAAALGALSAALQAGDVPALVALLAPDARALSDSAGEFTAARLEVVGASKVARLLVGLVRKDAGATAILPLELNGQPAFGTQLLQDRPGIAPRGVLRLELDPAGRVREVWLLVASAKLTGVPATV